MQLKQIISDNDYKRPKAPNLNIRIYDKHKKSAGYEIREEFQTKIVKTTRSYPEQCSLIHVFHLTYWKAS